MSNEFILSQALGHELEMAVGRTGGVVTDIHWLRTGTNFENVVLLARGHAKLVRLEEAKPPAVDPVVSVDRSIRPVYPDFLNQDYINTPEYIGLEREGPPEFDVSKLRQWRHRKQKRGVVCGKVIYDFLKQKQMLPSCLGLTDLLGIQAKDIEFFRLHFNGKAVFGWRSVVPGRGGDLCVACLVEDGGRVVLGWRWLDVGWVAYSPALRFAK